MKHNLFISYCHREVGFVDDLASRLKKAGHDVWLDYHSLIPGKPWEKQITEGLDNADVILLVVSKESLESEPVFVEWDRFLDGNKRLILIIFESVDLDKPLILEGGKTEDLRRLRGYEWVDFRGSYEKGLKELFSQLDKPIQEEQPAPESGFKAPAIVWLAFALSLVVMVFSFGAFWTLFIPWFLIPLPYQILKRNFNFTEVQTALLLLPIVLYLGAEAAYDPDKSDSLYFAAIDSLWFVIPLFFVLRSKGMQRWGKPKATMPVFAGLKKPDKPNPKPVSFFIDHATQDRRIAEDMIKVFEKYGHKHAPDLDSADTVIALLSEFNTDTAADPERKVVYTVRVQSGKVEERLKKYQWIDFSRGFRNLEAMAQLLPNPAELTTALGLRPMSEQLVLPPVIMAARYFILLLAIFSGGAVINYLLDFFDTGNDFALSGGILLGFVTTLLLIGVLAYFMIRHLTARKGWFAIQWMFIVGLVAIGVIIYFQYDLDYYVYISLDAEGQAIGTSPAILYPVYVYIIGGLLMALFFIIRRQDVRRWFPARA